MPYLEELACHLCDDDTHKYFFLKASAVLQAGLCKMFNKFCNRRGSEIILKEGSLSIASSNSDHLYIRKN